MIPWEEWIAQELMKELMAQDGLTVMGTGTTPDDDLTVVCIDGTLDLVALATKAIELITQPSQVEKSLE